jgi:hypothetical protein
LLERLTLGGTPVTSQSLDALDTEICRTVRDRSARSGRREEGA